MHTVYNVSHNYMFRPILGHLQVVPYSLASVIAQNTYLVFRLPQSLGYKEQPEDGLKWAETCSCEIYCVHILHKIVLCFE